LTVLFLHDIVNLGPVEALLILLLVIQYKGVIMLKHISKGLAALLIAILVTVLAAVPVMAADFRSEDTITISSGEVVDDDLYIAGSNINIDGTVNGDVWAVGDTININGEVNGSILLMGNEITINGKVSRAARIAGQNININNTINGDLIVGGTNLTVNSNAEIDGDLLFGASIARILGRIAGDAKGGGGQITIANGIGGDVELSVENLTIGSAASIQGNLIYTSNKEAEIQSGAQIKGITSQKIPEVKEPAKKGVFAGLGGKILIFLMILVIGIVIIVITPRKMVAMADSIRTNPWQSLGWGALILFVTPIAAIIVCFTVIGIPISLITLALWGMAIYLSQIPVSILIGRLILMRFREVESKGMLIAALAIGLVILALLKWIPVVSVIISLATIIFGLGSLVTSHVRMKTEKAETY
jgi:cytoskeletal protein CcmA (bactofilin family)